MTRAIENALTNAELSLLTENKDIEINVHTKDYNDITIKDSGIGIPKNYIDMLYFQKFTQAKPRGLQNKVSTGLR